MTELKIIKISQHRPDVWSFSMSPTSGPIEKFVPGQVAVLELEGYSPAYLAFASAPEDEYYEFLVRNSGLETALAKGLFELQENAQVRMTGIVGHGFPVEEFKGHDLVLVAMGTGIAPLRSTLRHVFREREQYGKLIMVCGARTLDDFFFSAEINEEWRKHDVLLRQVISRPEEEWSGPTGYVQSLLDNIVPELDQPVALICGSPEMIKQTKERLSELGFPNDKMLTNY